MTFAVGLVVYGSDRGPDAMLREAVRRLQAQDVRVAGLVQNDRGREGSGCATLSLEEIATGRTVPIFERRGAGARGCRLDPSGLAVASGWLREAVERRPDVLFVNRFGHQEAEGRGLLDEIAAALSAGLPVVLPLSRTLLPHWQAFADGVGTELAADARAIEAWCLDYARARLALATRT